jgi:hypothetical protein
MNATTRTPTQSVESCYYHDNFQLPNATHFKLGFPSFIAAVVPAISLDFHTLSAPRARQSTEMSSDMETKKQKRKKLHDSN